MNKLNTESTRTGLYKSTDKGSVPSNMFQNRLKTNNDGEPKVWIGQSLLESI